MGKRKRTSEHASSAENDNSSTPNQPANRPSQSALSFGSTSSNGQLPPKPLLAPWKSAEIPNKLPELPYIDNPVLSEAPFIHSGKVSPQHPISYERLEWVGDAYIYLFSTLLISQTFTSLTPGQSSQLRELLLKNKTLADYASQYGFSKRITWPREFNPSHTGAHKATDGGRIKVMADSFEAYVGAIIEADPQHGADRAASWLKQLWGRTIKDKIITQEREGREKRERQSSSNDSNPLRELESKTKLAATLRTHGVDLPYKDIENGGKKDRESGLRIYTVGVYFTGWGIKDLELGVGEGISKKVAGEQAAKMALSREDIIAPLREKKKAFDEARSKEREAAELAAASKVPIDSA